MAYTIAVLSQKGGTGKTTVVRTLSDAFRRRGVRTLALDLDPQGNLSDYFDLPPDVQPTIAEVLLGRASVEQATHDDMVPANLSLAEAELLLGGKMGRELTLRRAIAKAPPPYDLILIDCPPSLGLLTVNALVAADRALITAEAQYFALQGVEQAIEVVELARDSLNPQLTLLGVLLNVADMRTVHSRSRRPPPPQSRSRHRRLPQSRSRHRRPRRRHPPRHTRRSRPRPLHSRSQQQGPRRRNRPPLRSRPRHSRPLRPLRRLPPH